MYDCFRYLTIKMSKIPMGCLIFTIIQTRCSQTEKSLLAKAIYVSIHSVVYQKLYNLQNTNNYTIIFPALSALNVSNSKPTRDKILPWHKLKKTV